MKTRGLLYLVAAAILASAVMMLLSTVRPLPLVHAQATQVYNGGVVIPFTCRISAQTTTQECKALTAGLKTYVTDGIVSNNVGTAQTLKIVTGTGTNCGAGTADLTHPVQFGAAVGNQPLLFLTPLQPAAVGLAVCVTPSAATSYSATINGFVGPAGP